MRLWACDLASICAKGERSFQSSSSGSAGRLMVSSGN